MKNNVFAEIYAPISSLATTIQVKSGQGARFGNSFPQLLTIENFDSNGSVAKREIVKLTGVSGDYLTVVRGFAPCPPNDSANGQSQSTFSFNADDKISMYIPKEIFDRIANSIIDLYDNGNDRVFVYSNGGLNIGITAGNIRVGNDEFEYPGGNATLNDNATNYVMIDGSGTVSIDTTGRDQQLAKLATITTASGEITSLKRWKMDLIGGELGGGGGFKNISDCKYQGGNLVYFIADGEEFYLTYRAGRLTKIVSGEKTYTISYSGGKLVGTIES